MLRTEPRHLIEKLRDPSLLVRTGVLLVPADRLADTPNLAARLGVDLLDVVEWKLSRIVPGTRFLRLDADRFLADLDAIAQGNWTTGCVLVLNTDVLLANLEDDQRDRAWLFLLHSFKRRAHALILVLPAQATHLFPLGQRKRWEDVGRVAEVGAGGGRAGSHDDLSW
nr:MAG: hypothetical protein DIU57_17175 [Pseudomonadota bacterium]